METKTSVIKELDTNQDTCCIKIGVQLWSECNYRISENADISMVCWQSARGIYSKKFKNDENNAAQQDNGRRFHI